MLQINQIKLRPGYSEAELNKKISSILKVSPSEIKHISIIKQSIDARKKPDIFVVLSVLVDVIDESYVIKKSKSKDVFLYKPIKYSFEITGEKELENRPIIVGAGPCGLFAAYELALNGYKPIVLERGLDVDSRTNDVNKFWETGILDINSNVLFGEGGAGTFSDGKLNTLVKDKNGRNSHVLDIFVKYGAPIKITYEGKPHIGTDILVNVVKNMRNDIIRMGGEFRFNSKVTDIIISNNRVKGVIINDSDRLNSDVVILAIGHSARDTFEMLYSKNVFLEQKDFAIGFRVQHRQSMINRSLYTDDEEVLAKLSPAYYKLSYQSKEHNRGVYSFCMCPGGYVVNASSEEGMTCINGMSYSKRDGLNANSAIVMSVRNEDFLSNHPLAGIEYQRKIERKAYEIGQGKIPCEFYGSFKNDVLGSGTDTFIDEVDSISPEVRGEYTFGKVSEILSRDLNETFIEGMEYFERIIPGFSKDNTIVSGVESRTSSPVRITRDECFESLSHKGLFPAGEGAGYAGGITSAAMDGIKIFEEIAKRYKPMTINKGME